MQYRPFSIVTFLFWLLAFIVGTGLLFLVPVHRASAQCGTQASSCKNCHEVQGQFSVNSDGTGWHESHAFGDFCYVCHAGNQQATEIEEAHAGMVPPMSDTAASCQMCHAADLNDRAAVYNTILASTTGGNGAQVDAQPTAASDFWGSGAAVTSTVAQPTAAPAETTTATATTAPTAIASIDCPVPVNELVVDDASMVNYVQRYEEIVLGVTPVNWGNIAIGGLILLTVVGGGAFVVINELRMHDRRAETRKVDGEYPSEVVDMLPSLTNLKPQNRRALANILSNPLKTDKVLTLIDNLVSTDDPENLK